jgi:hypothetical protein
MLYSSTHIFAHQTIMIVFLSELIPVYHVTGILNDLPVATPVDRVHRDKNGET